MPHEYETPPSRPVPKERQGERNGKHHQSFAFMRRRRACGAGAERAGARVGAHQAGRNRRRGWRELTPVSIVAFDQFGLWVNSSKPYKTVKEFTDAAKTASPTFKMGGTGSKREDQILTAFIEKRTGAKFNYLPYKSGGEAATQLVGNHIAANVNNPSENLEVWRAGQVRALCVFDKERIEYKTKVTGTMSWNDVPTCKEEGLDVQYLMLRAMFLPGKATPDQTAFYIDLFHKVSQSTQLNDYF